MKFIETTQPPPRTFKLDVSEHELRGSEEGLVAINKGQGGCLVGLLCDIHGKIEATPYCVGRAAVERKTKELADYIRSHGSPGPRMTAALAELEEVVSQLDSVWAIP